eukprot:13528010-Ditylum_brightwellii.AAC.1
MPPRIKILLVSSPSNQVKNTKRPQMHIRLASSATKMTRRRTKSPFSSLEYATYVQSFAVPVISSNSFGGAPPPFLQRRRRRRKGMYHSVPNMSSSSSNNISSSNKVAAAWEDLSLEMQTK